MTARMNRRPLPAVPAALAAAMLLLAACSRTPSGVIPPERMAALMADMRMADAVVSVNGRQYRTDSSRYVLRQAVFNRNGVTAAEFDSSLVWYGHNLKQYQEMTDRSIEILEKRLAALGSTGGAVISVAGDSVDVWPDAVAYTVTSRSPSQYLTFHLDADQNWERGDSYTWRLKLIVPPAAGSWAITTEYDDGSVEVYNSSLSTTTGRSELTFYTDSTRTARSINGWLRLSPEAHRPAVIDSVSLVRRRIRPDGNPHNYRQVLYKSHDTQKPDSAAIE